MFSENDNKTKIKLIVFLVKNITSVDHSGYFASRYVKFNTTNTLFITDKLLKQNK